MSMRYETVSARIPLSLKDGITELIQAGRYKNPTGVIEQAIRQLLGQENVAPCRYCGSMHILNIDGLCKICAQAKEAMG